jgi:hypothetical protein
MPTAAPVSDFLVARENYKIALARHDNQERRLFEIFGVSDSASLDAAMLASRANGLKHSAEITEFARLGQALDAAGHAYDVACVVQRRKIAEQQAAFNTSVREWEC